MKKTLFILILVLLVFSGSVLAENIYDLQQDLDWVDKKLVNTIYERKEYQSTKQWYENFAEDISGDLVIQKERLAQQEETLAALEDRIRQLIYDIAMTEIEYGQKLLELKRRIADGYLNSKTNMLALFVESDNVTEFFEKIETRKLVARYNQELIVDIEYLAADLAQKKARAEALHIDYEVAKKTTEIAIGNIEGMIEDARKTVDYSAERIAILQREEKQLLEEADKILAAIKELQKKMLYAGGEMVWPVPANRSELDRGDYFGMRMHPIFKYMRMHTGIDIGAPHGANIIAANSGTVIMAGYSTGYGYRIVIDHGGTIATLYAHCSRMLVKVGQKVEKGQVIAEIGSTGWATGPHLHFEVMKEGERVDPLEYVTQMNGT